MNPDTKIERDLDAYIQRARDEYNQDEVEIADSDVKTSESEQGVWVAAWVWVSDAEMEG